MTNSSENEANTNEPDEKVTTTLSGTVEKVLPSVDPREPEKAQIHIDGAEPLYREIRVENTLKDASGDEVKLKTGAHVEVTIEADAESTIPKRSQCPSTDELDKLKIEYETALKNLTFPVSLREREELKDRCKAIVLEARQIAKSLNVVGNRWFNTLP